MSRVPLFNSPFLLGFDGFERALDRVAKAPSDGYPPYNVEQRGDKGLRITLAVAGFCAGDLSVTVEDNQLTISGRQRDDATRIYLHRGIAARQFQRNFVLADGIRVEGAALANGLLNVDLTRPANLRAARTIEIRQDGGEDPAAPDTVLGRGGAANESGRGVDIGVRRS